MSFTNSFDLHSPHTENGDHYKHAKKEDPLETLACAKMNIKTSQGKMDIFPLGITSQDERNR